MTEAAKVSSVKIQMFHDERAKRRITPQQVVDEFVSRR